MVEFWADTEALPASLSHCPLCVCTFVFEKVVYIKLYLADHWYKKLLLLLTHYSTYMLQKNINYIHEYMLNFGKTKEMCFDKQSKRKQKSDTVKETIYIVSHQPLHSLYVTV